MPRPPIDPARQGVAGEPFPDAEAAWFWCMREQLAAVGRAHRRAERPELRPCNATDVLRVAGRLARQGRLGRGHMRVLLHYGLQSLPPSAAATAHRRLWEEALARLEGPLRVLGIQA